MQAAPLDMVLSRLDGVVRHNGHFMARCPAHADRNPSLSVKLSETGNIVLTCYAGCDYKDILSAIDLEPRDLFARDEPTPPPKRAIKTTRYVVRDRAGRPIATHLRIDYDDGSKDVTWPVGTKTRELPLFGIDTRNKDHRLAIVTEGEKARDALAASAPPEILVVGTVCGAGATPNKAVLADLDGLDVLLWPDNDDHGRKHMERIATRLPLDPKFIVWPAAPDKGDAFDWIATGATTDDLIRVVNQDDDPGNGLPFLSSDAYIYNRESEESIMSPPNVSDSFIRPVVEFMTMQTASVEWLVEPWVRAGGLTLVSGKPKVAGKTTFVLHMIESILTGSNFLDRPAKSGPVVVLSEQGASSLREAISGAGLAAADDLHVATYKDFASKPWEQIVQEAFRYAAGVGAVLVVVDTLTACASIKDERDPSEAREAMKPLAVGCDQTGIACIVVFHDKKGESSVGESARGSSAYVGAVDIVVRLQRGGGNLDPRVRKIEALSRFEETPDELFVQLEDDGYRSLGTARQVVTENLKPVLLELLPADASQAMPVDDRKHANVLIEPGILGELRRQGTRVARSSLDSVLFAGHAAGAFGRTGEARKGSPYRYWTLDRDHPFFTTETAPPKDDETLTPEQAELFWRRPADL